MGVTLNNGKERRTMVDTKLPQHCVTVIAQLMGVKKFDWSRAVKHAKIALKNGFDLDDFKLAAKNNMAGDPQYFSLYSVFAKTDYWIRQTPVEKEEPLKGVW